MEDRRAGDDVRGRPRVDLPGHPERARGGPRADAAGIEHGEVQAAENTERIVSQALQVFGATGYQRGHPLEYLYRFNRSRRIGHGTDEILKDGIADRVFDEGLLG